MEAVVRRVFVAVGLSAILLVGFVLWRRHQTAAGPMLKEALQAIARGDKSRAADLLDRTLLRFPGHGRALLYRGQLAKDEGDRGAALRLWAAVPDAPPQEGGIARYLEGADALEQGDAPRAENLLLRAAQLHPDYLQPHERLARLYALQFRDADVRRELAAVRKRRRWTLNELIWELGNMGKINPVASRNAELERLVTGSADDIASRAALAESHLADDRLDDARRLLETSLAAHPQNPLLRAWLIETLVRAGELDGASEVLRRKSPVGADSAALWLASGSYFSAVENWEGAIGAYERALPEALDRIPSAYAYGQALQRTGQPEASARVLRRARLMERLVLQAWRLGSTEQSRAARMLPIAIEISQILLELERPADALAWLEFALRENKNEPRARELYQTALERVELATRSPTTRSPARDELRRDEHSPAPEVALQVRPSNLRDDLTAGTSETPVLRFIDRHEETGVDFQYFNGASGAKYLLETLGGGVAAFDFDGDAWPDLYFTQGCPLPVRGDDLQHDWRDRMYRNHRGFFQDITEQTGLGDRQYSQGCSAADFDNDGFVDLALANFGANVLYRNNGDGTFHDVSQTAGVTGGRWSTSLAFADLDRDGNVDLYVVTYVLDPYRICRPEPDRVATCSPLNFSAEQDVLLRNRGDLTFEDVTDTAGIRAEEGKGLGVIVADLDDDGWPDVYVANDGTPNFLFHNETARPGARLHFAERGMEAGVGVSGAGNSQAGMGIACADFDADGRLDLYVSNFYLESGTLYHNDGALMFSDRTRTAQLAVPTRPMLGFGTQALDADLDGRPDLFVANGHIDDFRFRGEPWKMRPQLFRNEGGLVFSEASTQTGPYFDGEYLGRGVARVDFDRDGRTDLVVVHQDRPAALLHNETLSPNRRVAIALRGVSSNRDALGARLSIRSGGRHSVQEFCGGSGFFASNEPRAIVGLGLAPQIDALDVRWPSGRLDHWESLPVDAELLLIEGRAPLIQPLTPESGGWRPGGSAPTLPSR